MARQFDSGVMNYTIARADITIFSGKGSQMPMVQVLHPQRTSEQGQMLHHRRNPVQP